MVKFKTNYFDMRLEFQPFFLSSTIIYVNVLDLIKYSYNMPFILPLLPGLGTGSGRVMKRQTHFISNFGDTFVINRANQLSIYLNYSGTPNQAFIFIKLNSIANYSGWCGECLGNLTKLPRLHRQSTILSDGFSTH